MFMGMGIFISHLHLIEFYLPKGFHTVLTWTGALHGAGDAHPSKTPEPASQHVFISGSFWSSSADQALLTKYENFLFVHST